jgi:amino acid transporter
MKTKKILALAITAILFFLVCFNFSLAQTTTSCSSTGNTISFCNPLGDINTVEAVLTNLLNKLQGIIVTLSIIFIIVGAILYITSAGNEKRMTTAKGAITASMIGLAIGIAAPSFLHEISGILGWTGETSDTSNATTLSQIALNTLDFLLSIVGILALIMLVMGGIMYLGAAGDEKRVETAKKILLYSIIGIVIALASMVITRQIATFFAS